MRERSERPLSAIVLAAGQGTRMRSARPKPLHRLCGRPLVRYVLDAVAGCRADRAVVVVGYGADRVVKALQQDPGPVPLEFVEQRVQRGTGDAVAVGLTGLPDDLDADGEDGDVVVLPGDTPLIRPETLASLVVEHRLSGAACTLLTARMVDPTGYGRVVRDREGRVRRIVEHRDANAHELAIDEINTSIYVFRRGLLAPALRRITPDNSQGELYVTDVVEVLASAGHPVVSLVVDDPDETLGVNDRAQLAVAEAELRRRTNQRWMEAGVTIVDPAATYVDATVTLAPDVTLFPGTVLRGATTVGAGSEIGPATRLTDTRVGERATVTESVATHAEVGDDAVVGPFAVLEPGCRVGAGTLTGPFYTGGG
ncbi:MAG TPA: NTP transferase domain-containing protein [Acidimicrobiales bacterium]|nr:NTP transferase domain-containing protein [Acidimicrobiales bacterium]